jgi:xylulokinase
MTAAGAVIKRIVAVGGGTQGGLWTQIVSDVTGLPQVIPSKTVGASYGAAYLAASSVEPVDINAWNPPAAICQPRAELRSVYDDLYRLYLDLYPATAETAHALAAYQQKAAYHERAAR